MTGGSYPAMDARQHREMLMMQQQHREMLMMQQQQQGARPRTAGADDVARHVRSMRDLQAQVRIN